MGVSDNKVAFVTGAGAGIDKAVSDLCKQGTKIVASCLDENGDTAVVEEIKKAGADERNILW